MGRFIHSTFKEYDSVFDALDDPFLIAVSISIKASNKFSRAVSPMITNAIEDHSDQWIWDVFNL